MNVGDVFELNEGEVTGRYSRWGKKENKEAELEPLSHGTYYIREETEQEYLVGSTFGVGDFQVLGSKHSFYVEKEQLAGKDIIYTIPKDELEQATMIDENI